MFRDIQKAGYRIVDLDNDHWVNLLLPVGSSSPGNVRAHLRATSGLVTEALANECHITNNGEMEGRFIVLELDVP